MCAKTCVAPLDRMKILLQAHSKHYAHLGVFSGLKGIVEKERFMALYKGNIYVVICILQFCLCFYSVSIDRYAKTDLHGSSCRKWCANGQDISLCSNAIHFFRNVQKAIWGDIACWKVRCRFLCWSHCCSVDIPARHNTSKASFPSKPFFINSSSTCKCFSGMDRI